jgi:hypothetical protein
LSTVRRIPAVAAAFGALLLLAAVSAVALTAAPGKHTATKLPPFEPVVIQRINLPSEIKEASTPIFTLDGRHLIFFSGLQMWIVATDGKGLTCLSCGLSNQPTLSASEQEGFATEFPDRKRVFFGAANSVAVLECSPSVVDCATRRILPVSLAGARPPSDLLPPGGGNLLPALDEGGGASPKLSPSGKQIAFSDVTTDAVEMMTLATLTRTPTGYVTSDPHVLNPAGPTSLTDSNTQAWSNSSALFEFKSFADGGADGTYVQVGGDQAGNPNVWELNFKTGRRTQLTAFPDWQEDDAPSPDGRSIVIESDQTMHRVDMLGALMPVRGFIDAPAIAVAANYYVAGPVDRQCDLQPWLFPASGDHGGDLMGEPLNPYKGGPVHGSNNVSGYPQWSPNGTEIALNTESYLTNRSAPYLLVAHLVARKPTKPLPIVSSQPGSWAPTPETYHGTIGSVDRLVLPGLASGTATVTYLNPAGVVSGVDSVTYDNYSDNGRDFVNGISTITNPTILTGPIILSTDLRMTGADTGYVHVDLRFSGIERPPVTVTGSAVSNYDGTTVSGPPHVPAACPRALPKSPPLAISAVVARRGKTRVVHAYVTASVAGAGPNEAGVDRRPVLDATVTVDGITAHTNASGDAVLRVPADAHGSFRLRVSAGDALMPTSIELTL